MSTIQVTPAQFEHKYQIAPNEIVFSRVMSDAAKILCLAINGIKSCAPSWTVVQSDMQKRLNWGREKMRSAMRELENLGYLIIIQDRKKDDKVEKNSRAVKGSFSKNQFHFSMDKKHDLDGNADLLLKNRDSKKCNLEGIQPMLAKPTTANPSTGNRALPMPDKPIPGGYASKKALPTHSQNPKELGQAAPKSNSRKYKRTEEGENKFQYLLGLEFGPKKEKLDEDVASYLAHTYSQKHLDDCYYDLQGKLLKKQNIKNPIGLFRALLKDEKCPRGKNCSTNEAYALQIANDLGWSSLKIEGKYVYDSSNPSKDVPLNIDPESFRTSLMGLYQSFSGVEFQGDETLFTNKKIKFN